MPISQAGFFISFAGPVFYFALLYSLQTLWPGYDPVSTGMSELGAVNSPYRDIMNYLGFSLLGIVIIVFAFSSSSVSGKHFLNSVSFSLLLAGGFAMFAVGFLPCDADCIDVTLTGYMHSWASTASAILVSSGIMLSAHPVSLRHGKALGSLAFVLGFLSLLTGPIMMSGVFDAWSGFVQRLGIGLSLLWIVIFSARNLRPQNW